MKPRLKSKRRSAPTEYVSPEAKWAAVVQHDSAADGRFFYSVKTTGIYCVPSCPAPRPLRKNVAFHDSPEAAERAGFRPCKRCSSHAPTRAQDHARAIEKACHTIQHAEETPTLAALARAVGMSTFHFHRIFKSLTGVTPKKYAVGQRAHRMRQTLSRTETVTEAIYKSGFKSNGRFYAEARQTLGMTPTQFRNGGADMIIQFTIGHCSLGRLLVAASDCGICAIFLDDNPELLTRALARQFPNAQLVRGDAQFDETITQVIAFIELPATGFCLPLDIRGTLFQQKVWEALRAIPSGTTVSYADLAQRLGVPKAVRAVARACAANTIAVAIPCHRVVRHDGTLSGYRWGAERKRALLAREAGSA